MPCVRRPGSTAGRSAACGASTGAVFPVAAVVASVVSEFALVHLVHPTSPARRCPAGEPLLDDPRPAVAGCAPGLAAGHDRRSRREGPCAAELRDGSHLAYLMDRARAGPSADRLHDEIAAGNFASMTELRAAEAERGTAYSSGADQDVGSARGSRYAEKDPHGRQQRNCAVWSGMTMPSGNQGRSLR